MANNNEAYGRPEIGKVILVPVHDVSNPHDMFSISIPAEIVEIGPCVFEVTEAAVTNFATKFEELLNNTYFKEALHYTFPSLFPTFAPIDTISDENPLKPFLAEFDELKAFTSPGVSIQERRAKLVYLMNTITHRELIELLELSYKIIKPTQVIKVKFLKYNSEGRTGYYVLHNCSTSFVINVAEEYAVISEQVNYNDGDETIIDISHVIPVLVTDEKGKLNLESHLPDQYNLLEITAINSWITNGLLSTYLMRPEYLQSICTNPLVGDIEFWGYVRSMMETQFTHLYSASKPLDKQMILYRGSQHFANHPVSMRTIIATSTVNKLANRFNKKMLARRIVVPAGTRIIDLTDLNILEKEVLILPSRDKLAIEPLFISNNYSIRNKYRIRNANEDAGSAAALGGAGAGSKGGGRRRKTFKQNRRRSMKLRM